MGSAGPRLAHDIYFAQEGNNISRIKDNKDDFKFLLSKALIKSTLNWDLGWIGSDDSFGNCLFWILLNGGCFFIKIADWDSICELYHIVCSMTVTYIFCLLQYSITISY